MKSCVIIYHANVAKIYKQEWIDRCINSVCNQDYQGVDIFELNYGDGSRFYTNGFHFTTKFSNHIHAMNYLIDLCLSRGYDVIFNTNLDDYYTPDRFRKQIVAINNGAQLVSSNFTYFDDKRGTFKQMEMTRYNIAAELRRDHNVIAHPVVAFHRSFFVGGLRYKDLIGYEDKELWQRAIAMGKLIKILPDYLLHYRIHPNQITKKHTHGK